MRMNFKTPRTMMMMGTQPCSLFQKGRKGMRRRIEIFTSTIREGVMMKRSDEEEER
jgi:hypothetical protein